MRKPLSMDLRSRALVAVDDGMSCRGAAGPFEVGPATEIRWHDQRRRQAQRAPNPPGGDTRSRPTMELGWARHCRRPVAGVVPAWGRHASADNQYDAGIDSSPDPRAPPEIMKAVAVCVADRVGTLAELIYLTRRQLPLR